VQKLLEHRRRRNWKSTYADACRLRCQRRGGSYDLQSSDDDDGSLNSQGPEPAEHSDPGPSPAGIRKALSHRCSIDVVGGLFADRITHHRGAEPGGRVAEAFIWGLMCIPTAGKVYGVFLELVTPESGARRRCELRDRLCISPFGLAQRWHSAQRASEIIDQYSSSSWNWELHGRDDASARARYVETVTDAALYPGHSPSNNTVRSGAERTRSCAIQGTRRI